MRDDLLLYYERELDYLRKMAVQFAEKHPKLASRLVLEPTKCEDPHVERLLEAFAFLAARVHLKIDDEFPEISEAMLTVIYPQLVCPVPSMSIVEFQPDPEKGKLTTALTIKKDSALYSRPVSGVPCTFRTCYDTTIWPLSVSAAEWSPLGRLQPPVKATDAVGSIRIELRCAPDVTLPALRLDSLRFFLDGEGGLVNSIYEVLLSRIKYVLVRDPNPSSKVPPVTLPASCIKPVGFGEHEGMIPFADRSFIGHRLLMEYFSFPDKFFFMDVAGLQNVWSSGFTNAVELIFVVSDVDGEDRRQRLELEINKKTFRLGCTPIVNLFSQVAEPIQLTQRKYEYPVVPDVRRPFATEIYSIDEVSTINTGNQEITPLDPFYSLRHSSRHRKDQIYWIGRRRPSTRVNDEGTDIFLSLVDLATKPMVPDANILSIRTTCTNRDLPSRLPFGNEEGDFELENSSSFKRIVALRKPTRVVRPPLGKSALWRLISQLSLNYLSIVQGGAEAFRQILRLYDVGRTAYSQNVIDSVLAISSKHHFARVTSESGITFARGLHIEMELDEEQFTGSGVFLFASVLEHFLGLCASLNSFTQLAVKTSRRKEFLHEWPPRAGRRILV